MSYHQQQAQAQAQIQASQTKLSASGMNGIDERVQYAHNYVNQIMENLNALEARIFGPTPQPAADSVSSTPSSLEGSLNSLNNRLMSIEQLTLRMLHG